MGPLPHKMNPEKKTGARRAIAYKPTPQENGEVNQRITKPRVLRGTFQCRSGAPPKLVLGLARQFRMGFGFTDFRCCLPLRSTSVRLTPSSLLAAGGNSGGHRPPLHSRPRKSGKPQNQLHARQRCMQLAPTQEGKIKNYETAPQEKSRAHWKELIHFKPTRPGDKASASRSRRRELGFQVHYFASTSQRRPFCAAQLNAKTSSYSNGDVRLRSDDWVDRGAVDVLIEANELAV